MAASIRALRNLAVFVCADTRVDEWWQHGKFLLLAEPYKGEIETQNKSRKWNHGPKRRDFAGYGSRRLSDDFVCANILSAVSTIEQRTGHFTATLLRTANLEHQISDASIAATRENFSCRVRWSMPFGNFLG